MCIDHLWIQVKFKRTRTVHKLSKEKSWRPRTARSRRNVDRVRQARDPEVSSQRKSSATCAPVHVQPNIEYLGPSSSNSSFQRTQTKEKRVCHNCVLRINMHDSWTELFLCLPIQISVSLWRLHQFPPFSHHFKGKSLIYLDIYISCTWYPFFLKYGFYLTIAFLLTHSVYPGSCFRLTSK